MFTNLHVPVFVVLIIFYRYMTVHTKNTTKNLAWDFRVGEGISTTNNSDGKQLLALEKLLQIIDLWLKVALRASILSQDFYEEIASKKKVAHFSVCCGCNGQRFLDRWKSRRFTVVHSWTMTLPELTVFQAITLAPWLSDNTFGSGGKSWAY